MIERRKLTTLDKLKIVVEQARCPLCGEKLGDIAGLDFDHAHALVNGGTDTLDNLRAVHRDCHKVKTHGNGATNRGSDRGEASKTRRLVEAREAREAKAQKLIEANSELSGEIDIADIRKLGKSGARPKRQIRSANRWPPKKVRPPYRRKGV